MNFKKLLVLFIISTFLSFGISKKIEKKVLKEIKSTYEVENFEFNSFEIPEEHTKDLASAFGVDNFFKITAADNPIGFAYISKAPSKTAQFDYLILLDNDLAVKKAKVLIYREEYGGEIGSKRWLKQFIGKTPSDDIQFPNDIVAIAGATISVRSMTSAVNDLLQSLEVLKSKNIL
ncbi:FMN-binding protein [Psychroserpens sp. MEBiC05023]